MTDIEPPIRVLRKFAQGYFRKPIKIYYRSRLPDNAEGTADIQKRMILINLTQRTRRRGRPTKFQKIMREEDPYDLSSSIWGGRIAIPSDKIELTYSEQYFLTLLHEIGHLKRIGRKRAPKYWYKVRRHLRKLYPDDLGLQCTSAEYEFPFPRCIKQCKVGDPIDPRVDNWYYRLDNFIQWLRGKMTPSEHAATHFWAVKEFQRRRTDIRAILSSIP